MLIKGSAIEGRQGPIVSREMGRNPIDDDANSSLVQGIYQILKIVRRAITACNCIKASDLITPGRIVGVLGNRHELDVSKAHLQNVVPQRNGHVAITQRLERALFAP